MIEFGILVRATACEAFPSGFGRALRAYTTIKTMTRIKRSRITVNIEVLFGVISQPTPGTVPQCLSQSMLRLLFFLILFLADAIYYWGKEAGRCNFFKDGSLMFSITFCKASFAIQLRVTGAKVTIFLFTLVTPVEFVLLCIIWTTINDNSFLGFEGNPQMSAYCRLR